MELLKFALTETLLVTIKDEIFMPEKLLQSLLEAWQFFICVMLSGKTKTSLCSCNHSFPSLVNPSVHV